MESSKPHYNYTITRDKFMTPEQAKQLLKTCQEMSDLDLLKGRRMWVIRNMYVSLSLRSGLRIAEVAALKHGDIHLNGSNDNYVTVRRGKGGKTRDVYCSTSLTKSLKDFITIKKRWNEPHGPEDYLLSHQGKQYTTTALDYHFRTALEKAGLPVSHWKDGIPPWKGGEIVHGFHPHSARHSYATILLQDTGDLRAVQKQLGHSSLTMTSLYADVLPQRRQELADRLSI